MREGWGDVWNGSGGDVTVLMGVETTCWRHSSAAVWIIETTMLLARLANSCGEIDPNAPRQTDFSLAK